MRRNASWLARVLFVAVVVMSPALLGGCSGEPTGDQAYSQKFEKPADAKEGTAKPDVANPYEDRHGEIKKAQAEPATKPKAAGKS